MLKRRCNFILFTVLSLFVINNSFAQISGDYRSAGTTMNWTAVASWQKYNGTSWGVSGDYPGQNACSGCTVTIQNGNTVTLNVSPANSVGAIVVGGGTSGTLTLGTFALQDAGNLTISAGAVLNLATGSLTVSGTTSVAGTVADGSNTGVSTFVGLVTKTTGSWTSTAATTAANMIFTNGFTNTAGSFAAGGATFGAGATILSTTAMSFANAVIDAGALTIDGTGGVSFGSTVTVAGNLSIAANSLLTYNGVATTLSTTAAGNLSIAAGATLSIANTGIISIAGTTTIDGTFIDNNDAGTNTFSGLVTNNGTFNTDIVTTAGNVRINAGLTNSTGATCTVTSLRLAGTITATSPVTMDGVITTNGAVTFAGGNIILSGTSNVTFSSALVVGSGASLTVSTTGTLTAASTTNIAGTLTDNDNTSATTFTGSFTSSGTIDFSALSTANIIFNGGLVHTSGIFNVPTATISTTPTGNDINATTAINFSAGVTFTGTGALTIAGVGGVTLSGTGNIVVPASLTLATSSSLTVSTTGNFTVTTTSAMAGSFTDNENTGITTFTGLVTKSNGVWTTTAVTTSANLVFTAGITQTGGTFTAGGASVPNGITLSSNPAMTFNNPLLIGGAGNITISGSGGIVLAGAAVNYTVPGNLTLTGLLTVSTSGNFTVTGTTSMTGTGGFTDNNNTGTSTFTGLVTHNSTGRWTSTAVTTAANMVFMGGFTNTAGTFSAGAATIADNKTLTGTVNMSFVNGVTVLGNADITIAGTAATGVTFGGTLIDYSIRNLTISGRLTTSTTGNLTVSGTASITGTGYFLDNNGSGITTFTGLVTNASTSTFTATAVTTIGRLIFAGGITQNNTTAASFATGTIRATATQTWAGAGDISTTGALDINAGTLTNNVTGTVTSGSTLTGNAWVQGANAKLTLGSTNPLTITTLTSTATGNTVTYSAAGNATMRAQTYYNLTITGSGNKIMPTADIIVNGNLTINAGVLSNTTNNKNITLAGNWINNVAAGTGFAAGTGTVTFSGAAAQTLGGTGATSFKNLTLNNSTGINQTISSIITGVLTLTSGKIVTGATVVNISSTGSVSRTSGYINGNEQRNIATGTNISRTYDIGDASNYTPLTLLFASVSVAGDVTAKSTGAEHPSIGASQLNSSLSINRYWTFSNVATVFTNYTSTFTFVAGDKDASTNTANLIAGNYTGAWTYPTVGTKTATTTQVTGLTSVGDFALAESLPCSTPTVVITNPAAICSPGTANLTAAAVTAGSTSGLTFTYWNDAAASSSVSSPSAVAAGTYFIKGTVNPGGCSDIKPVVVTRSNPTGAISGTATICTGQSTSITITTTGIGAWSGTLSNGTAFSGSSSPISVSVSPTNNTSYTIATLLDGNACAAQAGDKTGSESVTVLAAPTTADAGLDQNVCGGSVTLAGNTPSVGAGSWSIVSGSGGSIGTASNPSSTFTGTAGVTYVLRWTITNSPCTNSADDVSITFNGGLWTGAEDTDWNNANNWCGSVFPSGAIDLSLTAGLPNYPVLADNIIVNNLSIASGASITVTATGALNITGAYSNSGTLTNDGAIILNGMALQSFPGSSATIVSMKDLEIDNTVGVIIDKSFSITGTLTPTTGTIDLADKIITLASTPGGTARVATTGGSIDYSGGGKFIVQKYVAARRSWRLMTSPLTNANTIYEAWQNAGVYTPGQGTLVTGTGGGNGLDAAGSSSLKEYSVASQSLIAVTNTNVSISPGVAGSADNAGYFLFIRGDRNPANYSTSNYNSTILSSKGELQSGPQTFAAGTTSGNFTLIGNPYASPIDFNNVARTNLVKRFYVWDPALNTLGGYVTLDDIDNDGTFSKSVGGSTQTRIIQSQQAFFVETASAGSASLTVNETDKSDGTLISRPAATGENLSVNLYLLNADNTTVLADGTRAEFNEAYSDLVNFEDAIKFGNVNETFGLLRHGVSLALERRPVIQTTDSLFFKLTKTTQRNYQFVFTPDNLANHISGAILKDNYLETQTAISLNGLTTVNFAITSDAASAATNRFVVVLRPYTILPVTFTSIKAYQKQQNIAVEWSLANETSIVKYELEKSADGNQFHKVITTTSANSNVPVQHNWLDENPAKGNNFYRVKSIDRNGQIKYSQIVKVMMGNTNSEITAYPNPLQNNTINLQFNNKPAGVYTIRLINNNGQLVYSSEINIASNNIAQAFTVPQLLAKGIYQLEVKGAASTKMLQQVIVQ